jgi:hypothetical protein
MTSKRKKVKTSHLKKEFEKIDAIFTDIDKNKKLPTFGQFFVHCVLLGVDEKVNLRIMYPKVYTQVRKKLDSHNAYIIRLQKREIA